MKFCKILIFLFLVPTFYVVAQELETQNKAGDVDPIIQAYNLHRDQYQQSLRKEQKRFESEKLALENELSEIRDVVENENSEINRLKDTIATKNSRLKTLSAISIGMAFGFFPLLSITSPILNTTTLISSLVFIVFLPALLINLYVYLWTKERSFMNKHKFWITLVMLAALISIAAPAIAQETDQDKNLKEALVSTHEILTLGEHQRYIAILEGKIDPYIDLPDLIIDDDLLYIFPAVAVDTAEYYFTLAALYNQINKTGEAVDVLKKLGSKNIRSSEGTSDEIVLNSVKFLSKHQQQQAIGKLVENWLPKMDSVKAMLDLYRFLTNKKMQVSAEKALKQAINDARTVEDQLELTDFFTHTGETDKGTESIKRAIKAAQTTDELVLITQSAIKHNKDTVIEPILELYNNLAERKEDHIRLIDVFLHSKRNEDAASVFSNAIKAVQRGDYQKEDKLLFYTEQALQRNMLEQAISAVTRLSVFLDRSAFDYPVNPSFKLESQKNVPDQGAITLPLYYGLLNEEMEFDDKAESIYELAVLESLKKIMKSYGYKIPDTLNDYYLLGRQWKQEPQLKNLKQLDQVFTVLEKEVVAKRTRENDETLQSYRNGIEELTAQNLEQLEQLKQLKEENKQVFRELAIKTFSVISIAVVMIGILIGCAVKAAQYTKKMTHQKTFAFISKFIETTGWVRVMSVIGVISGLISVFLGQCLQIFHRMQEDIYKQNPVRSTGDADEK